MASGPTLLMRLVASAYSIAQKAGAIVRRVIAEGDLGIVEKTCATDLQTRADRLAQLSICSSLALLRKSLQLIGPDTEEMPKLLDFVQPAQPAGHSACSWGEFQNTAWSHWNLSPVV
ncbi:3'(2'), 5'-bisphosphate nucleotidase 1 [Phyllostomus discolor]|uniref:3'(2'), 5'-bisphosphate nucleotidase 1 n=1 Tax=Phyllostomus discolor TaxID=89673 RepID=A0A834D5T4_9CHIR|nr:3'(2'), 5'-bisphosphate nucleotidase 1 [Phyllostomus discolor]